MSFEETFNRILKLIGRTGDKLVVWDRQSEAEPFVLMSLGSYEQVTPAETERQSESSVHPALTEADLADKINDEISNWKNHDQAQYLEEEFRARNPWKIPEVIKQKAHKEEGADNPKN